MFYDVLFEHFIGDCQSLVLHLHQALLKIQLLNDMFDFIMSNNLGPLTYLLTYSRICGITNISVEWLLLKRPALLDVSGMLYPSPLIQVRHSGHSAASQKCRCVVTCENQLEVQPSDFCLHQGANRRPARKVQRVYYISGCDCTLY